MNREELLQAAKPILFNTAMVKAILEGNKSCTRRVIKYSSNINPSATLDDFAKTANDWECVKGCYQYQVGDILWVRETWTKLECKDCKTEQCVCFPSIENNFNYGFAYKADAQVHERVKWRPSIHMPKTAARLFLRVTDIHTERLCDIGCAPKISAEGVDIGEHCRQCIENYGYPCCSDVDEDNGTECGLLDDIRSNFADLWDSTVKKSDLDRYGWKANPWVWVIEFERVTE